MALPATDAFAGTNNDPLSANWTALFSTTWQIYLNHANPTAGNPAIAYWDADAFSNDGYAQVKIGNFSGWHAGVGYRLSASGGYTIEAVGDECRYVEYDNAGAVVNAVVLATGVTFVDSDVLRIEVEGTTIRGYLNGVQQGSDQTDATFASGSAGIVGKDVSWVDDFEGGNLGGGSAFPAHYYQQMSK